MPTLGVIAEDFSDVEVTGILVNRLAGRSIRTKSFEGRGCGKIAAKCHAWAQVLRDKGCDKLILVHDLDERRQAELLASLLEAIRPSPIQTFLIVIPVKELEAWFLADSGAVKNALKMKKAFPRVANPQVVNRPKETLRDLISRFSEKKITYVNTVHNTRIARVLNLQMVGARCPSFQPLVAFVSKHLAKGK